MEKKSTSKVNIPDKYKGILDSFYKSYQEAILAHGVEIEKYEKLFATFLDLLKQQFAKAYVFQPYHEQIRAPFDYHAFGLDFIRPLIDLKHSSVQGLAYFDQITEQLKKGENVIFLANHQIEADPQAINILLEKTHPEIANGMIYVAGTRVTTDPLAIPFSMGINLLCIHSKRYIEHPPEQKSEKQLHNKRTMALMSELLAEGGKAIYVAPSGGRDRVGERGIVEVAPFDPQSIEMFYLMAQKAGREAHFYPMALSTYDLLPPPQTIQVELGEERTTKRGDIHLAIGPEIDMEHFPGCDNKDRHERRQKRAAYIWSLVDQMHSQFLGA